MSSKGPSSATRSSVSGRYTVAKAGRGTPATVTKDVAARVEASWKRASEATGAFQTKDKSSVPKR